MPTAPDLAAHLRLVIARSARRLRQETTGTLGPSLGGALATIDRHGPLTPSEVAAREGVQRPSVTRMLARLEDEGLVVREPDPHDRRSCLVRTTPDGTRHLEEVRSQKDAFLARRLEALGDDERAVLDRAATLLERLLEDPDPEEDARP
ncbi:MarR family transcriptional regulator [Patulibacter sp. SYSU D01012]|uniref:MarR family winged helix-turn-helix transcriptional regulator n=1 Tax=Patulibacter sp. SYSU D01012 TaxID=2817381 RepID=UPI0032C0A233